jgi:carbonic anhydrase/acetyltransferase-like protein (isoleucine patch superfamily)
MKKYELTSETKAIEYGAVRYRIRALKGFRDVKAGDYGGWISGEYNLSQYGECWVYGDARVYGDAQVYGNAHVSGIARVYGKAQIYGDAWVHGGARVRGKARVYGNSQVYGYAEVHGGAWVRDNAHVYGDAWVGGNAFVFGFAKVQGEARISKINGILNIGAIGSRDDWTTVHKDARIGVRVTCGSFTGSLDEFAAKVRKTHGNNIHAQEYNALIALARIRFADALGGVSNEKV